MAGKMDFMSELAKQVEEEKSGNTTRLETAGSFQLKQKEDLPDYEDLDIPSAVSSSPVEEPVPQTAMEDAYVSDSGRPASYNQETFTRIEKPKRHLSPAGIGVIAAVVLALAGLIYYMMFAPKIVMQDFVGKNISEVSSWARQNKIESSSIARREEYSLVYAKDVVMEQSVEAGKKIRTDTPVTVTVSLGADPDEAVSFPADLKSMTQEEIREWANENQLSKFKLTTQYSDTVESGNVISYEVRNGSESEFTRGTTLNVVCSKGSAPAGQITMDNFTGKSYAELEAWARNKKITVDRQDAYSDTVENGMIVSTSAKQGDTLKEGDTLIVVVSKGKGVHIPNLVGYTKEQLEAWQANRSNTVTIVTKSIYNEAPEGSVIAQSVSPGAIMDSGDVLELTISLYLPILETNSRQWYGRDYLELKAWVDEVNSKGARIQAGQYGDYQWNICSDEYPNEGQIIEYGCFYGTSDLDNGCGRPLTLDARIAYTISTGACTVRQIILEQSNMSSLSAIQSFCAGNHITFSLDEEPSDLGGASIQIEYADSSNNPQYVTEAGPFPVTIPQGAIIQIHWARNSAEEPPQPSEEPVTQLVLLPADITDLATVQNYINTNGLTWGVVEDSSVSNIKVDINGKTYESGQSFQIFFNKDDKVTVYYNPSPVPSPES